MLERKSHLVWLPSVSLLFLALAAGAAAEELWVAPTHSVIASLPPALDVTWPVTSGGVAVFGFSVPDDMRSFDSARVVILPNGAGTGVYSVFAEVKRDGELLSPFDIEAQQNLPLTLTNDEVTEVDVSSVLTPVFDATSGGRDYVSLFFLSPSLIGNARVLGLRFRYERTPIGGSLLAPDAVDSSKVLDGSLTSSDVQNGSLTGADIADGTVGGLDIANGAIDGARILDGSVASADIQDFSITNVDVSINAAIAVGKIFGDAGVEFVDIGTVFDVPTTVMSLGSLQVTAPTAGFVVLALSGYAITFGDNTVCVVGFGTTANAITLGRVQVGTLDGTGTAREQRSIAMLFILPVSGGTNTFFINAQKPSTFSAASVNLDSVFAAALFVPKRY